MSLSMLQSMFANFAVPRSEAVQEEDIVEENEEEVKVVETGLETKRDKVSAAMA